MEVIKQKSIELLLGIISKEEFEMILYGIVEKEGVIEDNLLFDLVNINYGKDNFKDDLSEIIDDYIPQEIVVINKVVHFSTLIKDEINEDKLYKNFQCIYELIDFKNDYGLLWDFHYTSSRFDLVEIGYEKKEDVINNLKKLCKNVCKEYLLLQTNEEKVKFLVNGFAKEVKTEVVERPKSQKVKLVTKIIKAKKWYEFWK